MHETLLRVRAAVTMDAQRRVVAPAGILLKGNSIAGVLTPAEITGEFHGTVVDASRLVAIPGFVQTHIHLCQTLFRGLADDLELLDWLKLRIFPFEAAHTVESMHASAMLGIAELMRSGTTTIMDMGSIHHEEEIIRAVTQTGLRACVGKAMMDVNDLLPSFKEKTSESLRTTRSLAERWHGAAEGLIRYAVAPRFVLSCTEELLRGAFEMAASFPGMLFHTHAAENRRELHAVRKRCGMGNVEYFSKIGTLDRRTCLAHCIWLDSREVDILASGGANVLHCPTSNMKLGSGIARVPELLSRGITVSLGADGAPCNNSLDMFQEMRLAALIQKPVHGPRAMDAATVFEMATLGGARALGMEQQIGSIESGKKADITLLNLDTCWMPVAGTDADVYSAIVYSASPENVTSVMIDGRWVYRDGESCVLDEHHVVEQGRKELRHLMARVTR